MHRWDSHESRSSLQMADETLKDETAADGARLANLALERRSRVISQDEARPSTLRSWKSGGLNAVRFKRKVI